MRHSVARILICATALGISPLAAANEKLVPCRGELAGPNTPPADSDDDLGAIRERLDRDICWIARDDTQLQLLRAGLVIAVSARYAAAAIERYSENREEMALRVIPKINKALDALDKARALLEPREAAKPDRTYFEVYRADLIMRIAELLAVASEPTRTEIRGLFSTSLNLSFARRAFDLLKNATINELYGRAYRDGFMQHTKGIGPNGIVDLADFKAITAMLESENGGCKRLQDMAGNDSLKCKIPAKIK